MLLLTQFLKPMIQAPPFLPSISNLTINMANLPLIFSQIHPPISLFNAICIAALKISLVCWLASSYPTDLIFSEQPSMNTLYKVIPPHQTPSPQSELFPFLWSGLLYYTFYHQMYQLYLYTCLLSIFIFQNVGYRKTSI